ncbi:MAG TPA: AfsA-related hotdog domain-containing protein [Polyangiaceae bacterium]|nr:AfsA-related hotdog domain-containing protein [Polyangiaceae bacterium]
MDALTRIGVDQQGRHAALLRVDQSNPFFFDHALDHVPAMLMLEGMLQLLEGAHGGPGRLHVQNLVLELHRFCELTGSSELVASPAAKKAGSWSLELEQCNDLVASGSMHAALRGESDAASSVGLDLRERAEFAPAALTHRQRPENIMLGDFREIRRERYRAHMLTPPRGHYLRRRPGAERSMTEMIESCRQLCTLVMHARGIPLGHSFIVSRVSAEFPGPISRQRPVTLTVTAPTGKSHQYAGEIDITSGGISVAYSRFEGRIVSESVYARLRRRTASSVRNHGGTHAVR